MFQSSVYHTDYLFCLSKRKIKNYPAGIHLLKVNNGNRRTMCENCFRITIKAPERRYWCRSSIVIVNFKQISHNCSGVSIVDFEPVIAGLVRAATALISLTWFSKHFKIIRLLLEVNFCAHISTLYLVAQLHHLISSLFLLTSVFVL